MAWQLSKEVSTYLCMTQGAGLGGGEISILMAIAERASADGPHARMAWDGDDWKLQWFSGTSDPSGLRRVLIRLAQHDLEVRVQRGLDSRGRPIFAHRGMQTTYRLPALPGLPQKGVPNGMPSTRKGVPNGMPSTRKGVPNGTPSVPNGTPSVPNGTPYTSLPVLAEEPPLPPAVDPDRSGGVQATEGGGDFQTEQDQDPAAEEAARGVLRAVLTGFKGKISARDEAKLLQLSVAALSRISSLELKHHLFGAKDLNAAQSPVGLLVHRLTNLPPEALQGRMRGVPGPLSPRSEPEAYRTDAEREAAAARTAAAKAALRETVRAAAAKAALERRRPSATLA